MKMYAYIDVYGESFSLESVSEAGFDVVLKNNVQEIRKSDNDKSMISHHTRIKIPFKDDKCFFFYDMSHLLLAKVKRVLKKCRDAGAEELKIHIDIEYPAQCNLVAESKWLRIFGSLGVPLTIGVSHVPEPEEFEE